MSAYSKDLRAHAKTILSRIGAKKSMIDAAEFIELQDALIDSYKDAHTAARKLIEAQIDRIEIADKLIAEQRKEIAALKQNIAGLLDARQKEVVVDGKE